MHICPEEVAPIIAILEHIPQYVRLAWTWCCCCLGRRSA